MKAMIFAAGLGTRLRPLTNDRPKALVEVNGMSLLEIQLRRLKAFGIDQVVVNIHHFAELMEQRIEELQKRLGLDIVVSDERGLLLETGGGLQKAEPLLAGDEPTLVVNVDVVTNIDFKNLLDRFHSSNALALLALRQRPTSRYLVWDQGLRLKGWVHQGTGEVKGLLSSQEEIEEKGWLKLAFSGIHLISPELFPLIKQTGKFSIIDTYLDLVDTGRIQGYQHDNDIWLDVGKPETLKQAKDILHQVLL